MKHLLTLFFVLLSLFFVSWGKAVKDKTKTKTETKTKTKTETKTKKKAAYIVDTLTNDTIPLIHLEEEETDGMPQLRVIEL